MYIFFEMREVVGKVMGDVAYKKKKKKGLEFAALCGPSAASWREVVLCTKWRRRCDEDELGVFAGAEGGGGSGGAPFDRCLFLARSGAIFSSRMRKRRMLERVRVVAVTFAVVVVDVAWQRRVGVACCEERVQCRKTLKTFWSSNSESSSDRDVDLASTPPSTA